MHNDTEKFWEKHEEMLGEKVGHFSSEFKELFTMMTAENPEKRATTDQIKRSKWYRGATYSDEELQNLVNNSLYFEENNL